MKNTNIDRALLMLDSSPMATGFFNKSLDCVDCNNSAVEMFNFANKNDYLSNFYRTMPPYQSHDRGSVAFFKELLMESFENGKARDEMLFQRADGILLPTEITLVRVAHDGDDVTIAYFHDLTNIKAVMKDAQSSAEMANVYLSASPLAMEVINDQGRIIECNRQALDLLEIDSVEEYKRRLTYLAPRYLYHDIYTRMQDRENFRKALNEGYYKYEWVFQRRNGEKIPCEITRIRITRPNGVFVVSYIHDLSQVHTMAAELKKAEAAEKENRAKSQFLAQMSHVLRTPMNAISGIADIQLQRDEGLTREDAKDVFTEIRRSSGMLMGIINDILDLSRAESGNISIEQKRIYTPVLILEIVQIIVAENTSESIKLTLDIDENLPGTMIGDHIRIKQIANYILSNAFKYTEKGEVNLRFFADEAPTENYDMTLAISVSDTGQGMSEQQVKTLFGGRYNEQGNIQGTGLGLTITQRLVQLMNGTISVVSKQNEGSTFTARIPMKVEGDVLLGKAEAERLANVDAVRNTLNQRDSIEYEPMPYGKVLVVDDIESNLYVAWGIMKPYGLQIDTANSGFEALGKIEQGEQYDVIFMDHMMPQMDGIETARAIMDTGYENPIVALTANTIFGQESLFRENGFADFISKPIDIHRLNDCLINFVRDKYPIEAEKARAEAKIKISPVQPNVVSPELIKSFLRDAKSAIATLTGLLEQQALSPENVKLYTICTHGMKSSLANVNVIGLSKTAAMLEEAGRTRNFDTINAHTQPFVKNLGEVISEFEAKLEAEADAAHAKDDPEVLKSLLPDLIDACENYRKPKAKKALGELKNSPCSKETADFLEEISKLLLHGEFEKIAMMAQEFLWKLG